MLKSRAIAVAVINQLKLAEDPDLQRIRAVAVLVVAAGSSTVFAAAERIIQSDAPGQPDDDLIAAFSDAAFERTGSASAMSSRSVTI